jgi:hypothetical protein
MTDYGPLPSDSTCLICISPCKELSTDLFLYNCKCVYAVHKECFTKWRRVTKTKRICIICHEELVEIRIRQEGIVIHPGYEARRIVCINYLIVPISSITIALLVAFFVQYILTIQVTDPVYIKNRYLTNFEYNYIRDEL